MSMILILTVSAVLTSIISGIIGMAGGVTLLSIMTFFLPLGVLIPIHGVCQLVSNSSRTWFLKDHIEKKIFIPFIIGLPFGVLLSVYLIKELSSKTIPLALISILIFYTLFKPKRLPHLKIPHWAFAIIGFLAGFLGILVGATGPFMAPFFLRDDLDKREIVATKAATQMFGHLLKIPAFLSLGFSYQNHLPLIISLVLAAIIGTKIGVHLLGKVNDTFFLWLYKTALFLAGIRIVYKILTPYLNL